MAKGAKLPADGPEAPRLAVALAGDGGGAGGTTAARAAESTVSVDEDKAVPCSSRITSCRLWPDCVVVRGEGREGASVAPVRSTVGADAARPCDLKESRDREDNRWTRRSHAMNGWVTV